jgi:Holliday junction resolvase
MDVPDAGAYRGSAVVHIECSHTVGHYISVTRCWLDLAGLTQNSDTVGGRGLTAQRLQRALWTQVSVIIRVCMHLVRPSCRAAGRGHVSCRYQDWH